MATAPSRERLEIVTIGAAADGADFAREVGAGLAARPKRLSCRWLYDREGSLLFEEITRLREYYPTPAEREILAARAAEIAEIGPPGTCLVELGSGSAAKTRVLIEAFLGLRPRDPSDPLALPRELRSRARRLRYVPVDISRSMLVASSIELLEAYPGLRVLGLAGEFEDALPLLAGAAAGPMLVLFLGSTLGNLEPVEALAFLRRLRAALGRADGLLLGLDLRKDRATLERAYDDAGGVTARFNLNLLARVNRELGGRFDLARFRHEARIDERRGRVDMHLVSARAQEVEIAALGRTVRFREGETIHTESSYKYAPEEIDTLARGARLRVLRRWFDGRRRFSLSFLVPE